MDISKRLEWAVDLLEIKEDDTILEIGCGSGSAVDLMAQQIKDGLVVGVDRSESMISKAIHKNRDNIAAQKVVLIEGEFSEVRLPNRLYKKVFAFNVGLFWQNAAKELKLIASHLRGDGLVYIFQQPPFGESVEIEQKAKLMLEKNDFEVIKTLKQDFENDSGTVTAFCLIARYSPAGVC